MNWWMHALGGNRLCKVSISLSRSHFESPILILQAIKTRLLESLWPFLCLIKALIIPCFTNKAGSSCILWGYRLHFSPVLPPDTDESHSVNTCRLQKPIGIHSLPTCSPGTQHSSWFQPAMEVSLLPQGDISFTFVSLGVSGSWTTNSHSSQYKSFLLLN